MQNLEDDPNWRDGFRHVKSRHGTYEVTLFDASDDDNGVYDPSVPANFVRIVVTGSSGGATERLEALWVDPMSALNNAGSILDSILVTVHRENAL